MEVTNKGNNLKKKGDEGWESSFTWNKYLDKCNDYTYDKYFIFAGHKCIDQNDVVTLVSKKGFKNTGLNNGDNHIKCYFTTGTM